MKTPRLPEWRRGIQRCECGRRLASSNQSGICKECQNTWPSRYAALRKENERLTAYVKADDETITLISNRLTDARNQCDALAARVEELERAHEYCEAHHIDVKPDGDSVY